MIDFETYVSACSEPDTDDFVRNEYSVNAVTIYIFVNGQTTYEGEEISKGLEIDIMKKYAESIFTDANSLYLNLPDGEGNGEKAYDYLLSLYNKKSEDHHLRFLNNWIIVPIFIQNNNLLQVLKEYRVFSKLLTDYMNNNGKTFRQMPCVIFEGTDGRKNVPLMQELLQDKKSWKSSFPILLIYPNTDYEQIEFENRIKTIFITVHIMQIKRDLISITALDNPEWQCYSSRLLTISKPCHIEILIRAKGLLEFFLQKPADHEKALKSLASSLSSVPYESVWNRWSGLPCTEGSKSAYEKKQISVLPIYSLVFPSDSGRDQIKAIYKPFVEKYYYSHLPISTELINVYSIRDKFFDKYKYGYGYYITAFDELFNTGKNKVFKEMLELIEIEDFEKKPGQSNDSFNEMVRKLVSDLENQTRKFYDTVFSDACDWYKKARDNYKLLMSSLNSLSQTIDDKIKYWRGIEGDMTIPEDLWNDSDRKRLMNSFVKILKSDNPEEDFCELFIRPLFTIAKEGISGNRESYISSFDDHSIDNTVVSSWRRLLNVPQYRIVPNGQSNFQTIVICDNPTMLSEDSLKRINGDIDHFVYTDSGVRDRIEYIVLSQIGTWNCTMDEGEI